MVTLENSPGIPSMLYPTTSSPIILGALTNRTMSHTIYGADNNNKVIGGDAPFPKTINGNSDVFNDVTASQKIISNIASSVTSLLVTTTSASPTTTTDVPGGGGSLVPENSDSSTLAKITALLVITAIVLVISYRFVVRLFLGYTDRKDDVYPDGLSDEEEDSAVVKRVPEHYIEIT